MKVVVFQVLFLSLDDNRKMFDQYSLETSQGCYQSNSRVMEAIWNLVFHSVELGTFG